MSVFTLSSPAPQAIGALRSEISRAIFAGERSIIVDLDRIPDLDTPVLSMLISILREAHLVGSGVTLRVGRPRVLEALHMTALDKLFTIAPSLATLPALQPAPEAARRTLPARFAAVLVGILIGVLVSRASAASEPVPGDVVASIIAQNADMHSYQAHVGVAVRLRSFPYVSQELAGTTYFKRPDNYEVIFDSVPSYAKGFDRIYSDIGDPTSWSRRFDLSIVGRRNVAGHSDLVMRLVQKVRGMIDHEDVAIDPVAWRIDAMDWHYYNGGVIAMSQQYKTVGGFAVLAKQHATIRIPFVHAAADATYDDYRTNVAIDDSVFTHEDR
jgi:anti-anti-sigma regulatory factor